MGDSLNTNQKLHFLFKEKSEHRDEIIEIDRTYFKSLFLFFTLLGVFAGVYFSEYAINKTTTRVWLLFVLSQLQFILGILNISLISLQNVHVGYVRALENKINKLSKEKLSIWDTEVAFHYIVKPKSILYQSNIVIYFFYFSGFVIISYTCWKEFDFNYLIILYILQIIIAAYLFWGAMAETEKSNNHALKIFDND